MALHKYYQVVDISRADDTHVVRSFRTESQAAEFCNEFLTEHYMGWMLLTIRPVWSNASEAGVKKLLKED
jgi:hypothetical protein